MNVTVAVKQAGRKRALAEAPVTLPEGEWTLARLIAHLVGENVRAYNVKPVDEEMARCLTAPKIAEGASVGKVGFGRRQHPKDADAKVAAEAALVAFSDGLIRAFVDGVEITELESVLPLHEGSQIAFVRLVFLAGRMW